jgi:hypothetical protein
MMYIQTLCIHSSLVLGLLFGFTNASADVIKQAGIYAFSDSKCKVVLKLSTMGGFLQLYVQRSNARIVHVADDITGLTWVTPNSLVFSAGPIYGSPGVFHVTCDKKLTVTRIVNPENIDTAYPNGADYFELHSAIADEVKYYYGADVDKVNFESFRSEQNVRTVNLSDVKRR